VLLLIANQSRATALIIESVIESATTIGSCQGIANSSATCHLRIETWRDYAEQGSSSLRGFFFSTVGTLAFGDVKGGLSPPLLWPATPPASAPPAISIRPARQKSPAATSVI
jgi:hypothetical protein